MIISDANHGQMDDPTIVASKPSKVIENSEDSNLIKSATKEPVKIKIMNVFQKRKVENGSGATEESTVVKAVAESEDPIAIEETPKKSNKMKQLFNKKKSPKATPSHLDDDPEVDDSGVISLAMASMTVVGIENVEVAEVKQSSNGKVKNLFKKNKVEKPPNEDMETAVTSLSMASKSVVNLEQESSEIANDEPKNEKFLRLFKKKDKESIVDPSPSIKEDPQSDVESLTQEPIPETQEKLKKNSFKSLFSKKKDPSKFDKLEEELNPLEITDEDIEMALSLDIKEEKPKKESVLNMFKKKNGSTKDVASLPKSTSSESLKSDSVKSDTGLLISKALSTENVKVDKPKSSIKDFFSKNKGGSTKELVSKEELEESLDTAPETIDIPKEFTDIPKNINDIPKETSNKFTNFFTSKKKSTVTSEPVKDEELNLVNNLKKEEVAGESLKADNEIGNETKTITLPEEAHPIEEGKEQNIKVIKPKTSIFNIKKKAPKVTNDVPTTESLENLDNEATEEKLMVNSKEKSKLGSLWSFSNKKKDLEDGDAPTDDLLSNSEPLLETENQDGDGVEPAKPKRRTSFFKKKKNKNKDIIDEENDQEGSNDTEEPINIQLDTVKVDESVTTEISESNDDNNQIDESSNNKLSGKSSSFFTLKKKTPKKELQPKEVVLTAANSIDCLEAEMEGSTEPEPKKRKKEKSGLFHKKHKSEADLLSLDAEDHGDDSNIVSANSKSKGRKTSIFSKKKDRPTNESIEPESSLTSNEVSTSSYELDQEQLDFSPLTIPSGTSKGDKPKSKLKTFSDMMIFASTRPLKRMEPMAIGDAPAKGSPRNEDNELEIPDDRMLLEDSQSASKLLNETLEPSRESNITIEAQMQLLCDLFGHKEDVIWDSYTPNQREALKNKLKLVLDPETKSKKKNIEKFINDMTDTIWNQSKYSDGVLNMSILFVALLNEKELDVRKATNYTLRPVFRTTKCYNKETNSSKGCCMIFIDESGRVYRNWDHFIVENTYDPSIIVAPAKGIFNTDADGKVCMEFFTAPSSSVGAKLLSITDKTATVTGLGASACFIGGMLTVALLPVAAPAIGIAMAGAGLVGAASAGYSMVRSTQKMKDMSEHEKSLKITDAEARGHWLGLIGGMTGFVSGVASHGIDILARSGHHIPAFFRGSIDAINAASIAVNGVGVIDGFSTMFLKWNEEKISTMEIMQLSASLFMFTHSMYNFETASSIIKSHHNMTVNEFRDKLGQNQRHHYHKMAKESLKVHGKGHHDVIRSLRAIPDQQEFHKMHKAENVITEGMATAATLLVAKFCKKYFVVDENDLMNTILNAMTLLSDHAFDVFMDVVERFVECKGALVQKSLRGMISFEEVMSDILTSVTSISESLGLDASEFIETLTKTESFLSSLIDRIYDIYKDYERVEPNQTCAECKGVFTVKLSSSSKSSS